MIEKSMPDFIMQRVRKQIEDIFGEEKNQGAGITIAVLDSGVSRHPDLAGKIAGFRDFSKSRNQSGADSPFDDNGHGTHVCGIHCGSGLASGGRYRGIAPGARLIVGKVLDDKGEGEAESLLEAMDWILSVREKYAIRILNLSWESGNSGIPEGKSCWRKKQERSAGRAYWWYVQRATRVRRRIVYQRWENPGIFSPWAAMTADFTEMIKTDVPCTPGEERQEGRAESRIWLHRARTSCPATGNGTIKMAGCRTRISQKAEPPWQRLLWRGRQHWHYKNILL